MDDKQRRAAVKVLKNFGVRVQKSVFECPNLDERNYLKMKTALDDAIDHTQDTLRFYSLCEACLKKMEFSGVGDPPDSRPFKVI